LTGSAPEGGADAAFRRRLEAGRFMIQRSRSTGRFIFYPRAIDPDTGLADLEWIPASGSGTVYSTTIVRKKPPEESYSIVLVDLAEGPRMMSRIIGTPPGAGRRSSAQPPSAWARRPVSRPSKWRRAPRPWRSPTPG
jgi:uncharacterized OB-fold protein